MSRCRHERGRRGAAADSREQRLRRAVARVAGVAPDSFGLDDDLYASLALDSLSVLRVAAGIEREFGVTIPDEKLHEMPTARAVLEYLEKTRRVPTARRVARFSRPPPLWRATCRPSAPRGWIRSTPCVEARTVLRPDQRKTVPRDSSAMLVLEVREGAVVFAVRVQTRASRDAVEGVRNGALRVRLTAPPVDERANRACCRILAEYLNIPVAAIRILAGQHSRAKRVEVRGISADRVRQLAASLGPA